MKKKNNKHNRDMYTSLWNVNQLTESCWEISQEIV